MICECQNPILSLLTVTKVCWDEGSYKVAPREYSALAFRVKGTGDFISDSGNFFVGVNDILYLPQGLGYDVKYTDTEMLVFHFTTQNTDSLPEIFTPQNTEQIYKLFLQALMIWESKESGFLGRTYSILYKILALLFENSIKENLPDYFLNAVSFINTNFRENINIKNLCRDNGISESGFRQIFKKYYSKTPVEYITDLRLEYARNLIAGNMPITEAATQSGFQDPKYFARVVKKYFGCTPRDLKMFGK